MSALDGFYSTWSKARATFGEGTPSDGSHYDGSSSQLLRMKGMIESAAPDDRWQGTGSEAYAAANKEHAGVYEKLAELDKKMAAEVTNAANVVTSGRNQLNATKSWVDSAVNSLPSGLSTADREKYLIPIAREGISHVNTTVQNANRDMFAIGTRVTGIKGEYDGLTNQKFADDKKPGAEGLKEDKDGDGKPDEAKTSAKTGAEDSEALQNGELTPEQRERLIANTTLDPAQQAALDRGDLQLPPERMAYLQGFSHAFGDKTPTEIEAIMDKADAKAAGTGGRVADVFQLASNEHIKTGLPETNPPSIDQPASGGKYALPEGVQRVLDGPVLTPLEFAAAHRNESGAMVPGELIGASRPVDGLNDLADIVQRGNRDLQAGTALDSGLFSQSERLLEQSNGWAVPGRDLDSDRPRWYQQAVDPTLQNMFNAVNKDDIVIHDAIVGSPETQPAGNQTFLSPEGKNFLDNLTQHQWQDDGLAAGGLFDWVGETANQDFNNRASDTAHALAEFTSDNHNQLLNLPGTDGLPLGQVNPELTRDWARDFAPYLDDMVGAHDGDNNGIFSPLDPAGSASPENTRHLMSVLMSDQPPEGPKVEGRPLTASEILFNSTENHVNHSLDSAALSAANPDVTDDKQAAIHAGRLQAALDLGSYDEARDRLHDDYAAKASAWELRSKLWDLGKDLGSTVTIPGVSQGISAMNLGKEFFIGEKPVEGQPPNVDLPPDPYQVQKHMTETLINKHFGDPSIFGNSLRYDEEGRPVLIDPPQSGTEEFNEFRRNINKYLEEVDPTHGFDILTTSYWQTYAAAVNHGYQQK